jgi:mRNA interferase MazF
VVTPAAGAVVLVRFPFSDLSQTKLRPPVVLADVGRGDCILCQITRKPYGDASAIELDDRAFVSGSLRVISYARPSKLFTANQNLITSQVGNLKPDALRGIAQAVAEIVNAGKLP